MQTPRESLTSISDCAHISNPLVSVIMPCYNDHPEHVDEAIGSALAQSYRNVEVLLIDDGSSDPRTVDYLKSIHHPQVTIVHQRNAGPAAARNKGVSLSSGKYILPLDSDDKIAIDYVEHAVSILESSSSVPIVYGNAEYFGAESGEMPLKPYEFKTLLMTNMIFNSAVYRREDFDAVGGYNERLVHGFEDHEIWLKICARGGVPVKLDKTVLHYRIRPSSRNKDVKADRRRFVETQSEIFRSNIDAFAMHPEVIFDEIENLKTQLRYWQRRYGPVEGALSRYPLIRRCASGLMSSLRLIVSAKHWGSALALRQPQGLLRSQHRGNR